MATDGTAAGKAKGLKDKDLAAFVRGAEGCVANQTRQETKWGRRGRPLPTDAERAEQNLALSDARTGRDTPDYGARSLADRSNSLTSGADV